MTDPIAGTLSYKVTSSSSSAVTGTVAAVETDSGSCEITENTDLTDFIYGRSFIDVSLAALSNFENVTYAGRTVEAHVIGAGKLSGITAVVVMNSTGIILNITSTTGTMFLTSWEYEACVPAIPGYELPILLTIAGISILGIIFHVRKKKLEL